MFTKTSTSAIRALVYLGMQRDRQPISPRAMARQLGESPTYLAKVVRHLARAGILQTHRGVAGGVLLNRLPEEVTLRAVVEACQGTILGDFCSDASDLANVCALHRAGAALHEAIIGVLSRWTLADLLSKPCPSDALAGNALCWLEPVRPAAAAQPVAAGASATRARRKAVSIEKRGRTVR